MNLVPIKYIAKELDVRPVRIKEKAVQLELAVDLNEQLTLADTIELVRTYKMSTRVGERTRELSANLLAVLNNEEGIQRPSDAKKVVRKRSKKRLPQTLPFGYVKTIVDAGIQMLVSKEFKFIALMVAVYVQMQHSAIWFHRLSTSEAVSWATAYGYAFMVDLFILVVTLEGRLNIAKTFAVLTFFSNVLYFQFWVNFDYTSQAWTNAVSSLMVSGIMAYIIYAYTEIFVKIRLSE